MKPIFKFLKSNYPLLLILLLAAFWRFYNYPSRWVLNQDQARDATIALYAIHQHHLPLVGSPSSAGPFNFGPLYDWLIMFTIIIFPFVSGPWFAFTLLSLSVVLIFYFIGQNLVDRRFGLIAAFIAAISSLPVKNSPDMLNTVLVLVPVSLALLFLVKFITTKKLVFAFLLAFFVGFALNCHFQALGALTLPLTAFLFNKFKLKKRLLAGLTLAAGLITSILPLIYFDMKNSFVWINSVIYYYTVGVKKFYTPIRWLTEIRDFWPHLWGDTIFNLPALGYPLLLLFIVSLYVFFRKTKKINLPLLALLFAFFIQIFLLRYYGGTRSPEYLIAFHPFLILFTAFSLSQFKKNILIPLLILFFAVASYSNLKIISQKSQSPLIFSLNSDLNLYHSAPYSIYTIPDSNMISLPIFYLNYYHHHISSSGFPLATCINCFLPAPLISHKSFSSTQDYRIYDLRQLNPTQYLQYNLKPLTPPLIYSWLYINYPQILK